MLVVMVFNKLLALLKRKQREPPIHKATSTSTPDFIIVPPPEQPQAANEPINCEEIAQANDEEQCEEPVPFQIFHAVDTVIARKEAIKKGLLILFKGHERWDLFGRGNVYFALTKEFALKLLRLESDMKNEQEFSSEEREILRNLALKGWIKRLQNGGVYYYGLNRRTAIILQRQLFKRNNLG